MLSRTHVVISVFFVLILMSFLNFKEVGFIFVVVFLIASLFPDIDIHTSKIGKKKFFRPLQVFLSHRGFLHSFSFLIPLSLLFYFFIPRIFVPFLIGYSFHLFIDAFTIKGIQFFYPFGKRISGRIKTGSRVDDLIFLVFGFFDLLILGKILFGFFSNYLI